MPEGQKGFKFYNGQKLLCTRVPNFVEWRNTAPEGQLILNRSSQPRAESQAVEVKARYRMRNQVPEGQKIELSRAKQIALGIIATPDWAITRDYPPLI